MKKYSRHLQIVLLVSFILTNMSMWAQTTSWDYRYGFVTVTGGEVVFSSPNPKKPEDIHLTKEMLYKITFKDIARINDVNYRGGIKANLQSGGGVSVRVYLYDPSQADGKGPIIFGCSRGVYDDPTLSSFGYDAPDAIQMRVNNISQEGPTGLRPPDNPGYKKSDNMKAQFAHWAKQYAHNNTTGSPSYNPFNNLKDAYCNVVVELKVKNATLNYIRIPGLRTFAPFDLVFRPNKKITDVQQVFNNPASYPNWLFIVGHRGYFKDVPENSQEAMRLVMASQIPAIEIDVHLTKDSVWVLSHDANLGNTRRTTIPQRLMNRVNVNGEIPISELTLCELRPDLCPEGAGHFAWEQQDQYEPVYLSQPEGDQKVPIATLGELLLLTKNKVLVDVDKVDKGGDKTKSRFDLIYNLMRKTGMDSMMIVKGGHWASPAMLKDSFPTVNWKKLWYTPTYFWDRISNDDATNKAAIDAWVHPQSGLNCPGFELIYMRTGDNAYRLINYIKGKGKHVIQFPMWPEYCEHITVDSRTDYRNSWNWLLDHNTVKRPTSIITDRLEVLVDLLKASGLQNAGSLNW